MSIIQAAQDYTAKSDAFVSQGGASFFKERSELREVFCHLPGVLTSDQINSITTALPNGPVQDESEARLKEWNKKLQDGLIKKISDSPITVEEFSEKTKTLYIKYTNLLNSSAYADFHEAKDNTRAVFIQAYRSSSVEAIEEDLKAAGIDENFIKHASNEWGRWKAKI